MSQPDYSVLVLGLDGATFDLMLPWIEQGHLPCLAELVSRGARSPLRSTIPPITPCAWSSFMTGKNPGKHGLFDFIEQVPGTHGFRFTNASSRHAETLWGYLSRMGRRVGVMNVPMTYPPEPVNGYLVAGLDTPHERSRYTYPDELREELHDPSIGYRIDLRHLGNMRSDRRRDNHLRELCDIETVRTRAMKHLSDRNPSDFTMLVYTATDQVQHHFWHYMDPSHDKYDPVGAERYRHAIREVYIHIDRLIASVLQERGDDTLVIVMSDHGFGPVSSTRIRLNQAFERNGLLAFQRESRLRKLMRSSAGVFDGLLRSTLSHRAKALLAGMFPRLRVWFENLDEAGIDWSRTAAFTNEMYRSCPAVWVNRTALGEVGSIESDGEVEKVMQAAEEAVKQMKDPQTGKPAIGNLYRAKDVYHGPYVANAPDFFPSWWEDGFLLEQSVPGDPSAALVQRSTDPVKGGVEFAGTHRLNGVFIAAGGPVRQGHSFTGADITDVAPTVLYLMGLPIPDDMDGRPLLEVLDPEFVAQHPPRYASTAGSPDEQPPSEAGGFTEEEEEMIAKRLQSLGYIE